MTETSITQLQSTITDIDAMQQRAFSEIAALASLASFKINNSDNLYQVLDDTSRALSIIMGLALEYKDTINGEAEMVGCNFSNGDELRRYGNLIKN